ncbi:MAG: arginine--tRNA ligase [Planctomycetota bacterium]
MSDFKREIAECIAPVSGLAVEEVLGLIARPRDESHGDFAFPCFVLAKQRKMAPPKIAAELAAEIQAPPSVSKIEPAGPYLNFFIDRSTRAGRVLEDIEREAECFGSSDEGKGQKVVIDFSSPNIAKPFGIGHLRSTVIGNAIGRLLRFRGFETIGVNHLGDWGTQFGMLMVGLERWGDEAAIQASQTPVLDLNDLYVRANAESKEDTSIRDEARAWFKRLEDGDAEAQRLWTWFKEVSLKEFERIYQRLGVTFDHTTGESFFNDKLESTVETLEKAGLVKESEGAQVVDLEPYDMPPCLLRKSDGATLYATRDLAAALYRHEAYGFDTCLYVVGTPQSLHFQQFFKVLELLGKDWAKNLTHVPFGLIKFEGVKMATRLGNLILLDEVLQQAVDKVLEAIEEKNPDLENKAEIAEHIGIGAVIFNDLRARRVKDINFRWEDVLNFEGESGPYVQYTYVRFASILRKADQKATTNGDVSLLQTDEERGVLSKLEQFPDTVRRAAAEYEPSIVSNYLLELSALCNSFLHKHRFLSDDVALTRARLRLASAVRQVLGNGMRLLGMTPVEEM